MTAVASPLNPPTRARIRVRRPPNLGVGGWLAVVYLASVALGAVFAPLLAQQDSNATSLLDSFAPPSGDHWLGTDATGRDIASRLLHGARTSLLGPAAIVLLALSISIPLALVAVWRGGWVGAVINRAFDIVFAIPGILLAILTVAVLGPGLRSAVAALAVAYVPFMARVVMSAAAAQSRLPYVEVLVVQGLGPSRIMARHVLRNIAPILVGQATITFAYALIDLAALSFLGLGVQAPHADWGVMVADRDGILQGNPQQVIFASVAIIATVLALLILGGKLSGEGIRVRRPRRRNRK